MKSQTLSAAGVPKNGAIAAPVFNPDPEYAQRLTGLAAISSSLRALIT